MNRPYPSQNLVDLDVVYESADFSPASDVRDWIWANFLDENSAMYNAEHEHLTYFDKRFFEVLWASSAFIKAEKLVFGQCEKVMFRAGGWQKLRQEKQMLDWFGHIPTYLITLDAKYCSDCSDIDFCALVEHELCHIGAKRTEEGDIILSPMTGQPKHYLRGHDVEEFNTVVKRYGASEAVQQMVELANAGPTISKAKIAQACGTCILRLA